MLLKRGPLLGKAEIIKDLLSTASGTGSREVKGLTPCSAARACWSCSELHFSGSFLTPLCSGAQFLPFVFAINYGLSDRGPPHGTEKLDSDRAEWTHLRCCLCCLSYVSISLKLRKYPFTLLILREGAHLSCPPASEFIAKGAASMEQKNALNGDLMACPPFL